jgi:iron-sulfur cluster repair protein YtfE (RIC family)
MLRQIVGRITTATKKAAGVPLNGLDLLRADHMRAEGIAIQLRLSRDKNRRKQLLGELTQALDRHMRIEEEVLYPACARIQKLSRLIDHARTDHQLFKNVLKDLAVLDPCSGHFNALLTKAIIEVEKHVYEEENRMFGRARRSMSRSEFRSVNRQIIEAHREEAIEQPRAA